VLTWWVAALAAANSDNTVSPKDKTGRSVVEA